MIQPEVLDALLKAGATAEMIVAAVKADQAIEEQRLTEKRAKDADRQRRHRASRDVTVTECDSTDIGSPLSPPLKNPPDPLKTPPPISPLPPSVVGAREFHRLPIDWKPTRTFPPNLRTKLAEWPPGAVEDELEAFHRWALNAENKPGKGRKRDWDTAFHNWLDRKDKDHRNGREQLQTNGLRGSRPDPSLDFLRQANADFEAERGGSTDNWGTRPALPAIRPG